MEKKEYAIEIEGLVKQFGDGSVVLKDVNIRISHGEIVGYLGPNGSGKTTTIKVLTNMIRPTKGKVKINGIDVQKKPKQALKHIGALIEVPGVYDYLTPREMLTYFGKVYGMSSKVIKTRIVEVMKEVRLSGSIDKKIGSFSTGMQRRLMIAKAILHDPDILILDEPVIGLDPKGIKEVRDLIKKKASEGKTIFLSSHLLGEVADTADRVVFLNNGTIVEDDTVENIQNKASTKKIDVSFSRSIDDASLKRILQIPGVTSIKRENGGAYLGFDGKPESSHSILKAMISTGYPVYSFNPATGGLEKFYVSIMGDEKGVN
jgi:ABC-2 type transport system ATP-binding protein